MALTMSNALVGTGLVAKPAVRSVQARAGLKVFARMTKDRVGLKKDQKLGKSRIEIYPVRTRDSVNTLSSPARRPLGTYRRCVRLVRGRFPPRPFRAAVLHPRDRDRIWPQPKSPQISVRAP